MGLVARAAALALLVLCLAAPSAFGQAAPPAQTFTVTTTADDTPGACDPSHCTLREAVIAANTFTNADTISVPTGTYLLTIGVNGGEPNTAHEDLDISQPVTIRGVGARTTIVDQQQSDRVFEVLPGAGNVRIEGLAITGGQTDGDAGGFRSDGANTTLTDVAVRGNTANGQGGGIQNMNGTLTIERSLIVGNSSGSSFSGGGIHNGASGILNVSNSTISGNAGEDSAALADEGTTTISYSTIVNNTSLGGGAVVDERGPPTITVRDSIIANNSPQNCIAPLISQGRNIDSANTCGFDRPNTNPLLGALADNGGQTDTHHPLAGSPAIDAASSSGCPIVDQRGFPRPSGATCDIGAVELQVAPPPPPPPATPAALFLEPATAGRTPGETHTATAIAQNNDGSPAAGRSLRYEVDGVNETAGALTTDASGRAQISWKGVHEGTDVLKAYVDANTNQTLEPSEPTAQSSVNWVLPAPVQGRTANIEPVSGRVRITVRPRRSRSGKVTAAGATSVLTEARQVPLDTVVDVRKGRVRMTTTANRAGDVQKGEFYGGVYTTRQTGSSVRPVTELRLTESLICQPNTRRGRITASRARSRRLWGNGRGRYRTRGRHSTATVRGTIWLQKDTCTKTTTVVRQGVVDVRDLAKRKTVRVRAGKRYVARRASRRR